MPMCTLYDTCTHVHSARQGQQQLLVPAAQQCLLVMAMQHCARHCSRAERSQLLAMSHLAADAGLLKPRDAVVVQRRFPLRLSKHVSRVCVALVKLTNGVAMLDASATFVCAVRDSTLTCASAPQLTTHVAITSKPELCNAALGCASI